MLLSEGQMSDYKGAALMLDALPRAKAMLGDKGYDADWFRNALIKRGILPCIPSKANRKIPIAHDQTLYRQRHKIDIDQAWRLSRFCGRGGGAVGEPRRRAAPMRRRRADRLQRGDRLGVGAHQLGTFRAAANVSTG